MPLFIVTSSSRARYGIMASPPSLSISPGMQSGPTDLFFPIVLIHLLIVLIPMVNGLIEFVPFICGILSTTVNAVEKYQFSKLAFHVGSVMFRPLQTLMAGMLSVSSQSFNIFVKIRPAFSLFA